MTKIYRIKMKEQWFDFGDLFDAKRKVIEMVNDGMWFLTLEEFEREEMKRNLPTQKARRKGNDK